MMNKRLKLDVSQSFESKEMSVLLWEQARVKHCCMHTKKISSEHQAGPKQRAVLFDVTLMGCKEE